MSNHRVLGASLRWVILLFVLAMPFAITATADAHALLASSTPADGASYDRSPADLELVFTENVQVAATSLQLFDGKGSPVLLGQPSSPDGASQAATIRVPLGTLAKDRYLLRWRTISSDDLHPTAGTIVFGVGTEVTGAGSDGDSGGSLLGGIAEATLRWLALMALGVAAAALLLTGRLAGSRDRSLAPVLPQATVLSAGIGTLATAALAVLYLGRIVDAGGVGAVTSAWQFTVRWIVAVATAGMAWSLLRRRQMLRRTSHRGLSTSSFGLLLLSMAAITSVSHAASAGLAAEVIGAVHTITTMLWACGAGVVAAVAVPALRRGDRYLAAGVARAFTPIAIVMVPISLVTGLVLAGRLLPSFGAVLHTDYGHALLVKLALVAIGLACAGLTVLLLVVQGGRRRGALIVGVEAVVLGAVVLAGSSVAATHPASAVVWAPASDHEPTSGVLSQLARDLVVTLDIGPGRPGRDFFTVGVLDTRRPAPAPIKDVQVAVGSQAPLTAVSQGNYQWLAAANVDAEGPLRMQVTVERSGEPTVTVPFEWTIGPPAGTRLGGAALSPVTAVAAAIVAVVSVVVIALLGVVRWRRRKAAAIANVELPSYSGVDT
jgi:copper transport protein